MRRWVPTLALAAGLLLAGAALWPAEGRLSAAPGEYRAFVALTGKNGAPPPPTPVPTPLPYLGPIASLYVESASIFGGDPIEQRGTHIAGGVETFDDPTHPSRIAWYPDWGSGNSHPGWGGSNTMLAAHINYVNYGNAPFAHLTSADTGANLYVTMADGTQYRYTIQSVSVIPLNEIDMDAIVFPDLPPNLERVTLLSCGGTFLPRPGGGGEYLSRVVLVAERYTS